MAYVSPEERGYNTTPSMSSLVTAQENYGSGQGVTRDQITALYRRYLGRDPEPAALQAHLRNPGGLPGIEQAIKSSQEYRARPQQAAPAAQTYTGQQTTAWAPTGLGGQGGGGYRYEGFDFGQDAANRDTGKSAKYAFADATRQAGGFTGGSKADWQTYLSSRVKPLMESQGYTVLDIVGERMLIATREEPQGRWFDVGRGAGGADWAFAWQPDDQTTGTPTSTAFTGTPATTGAVMSDLVPPPDPDGSYGSAWRYYVDHQLGPQTTEGFWDWYRMFSPNPAQG